MAPRSEIDRADIGVTDDCGEGHIRKYAPLFVTTASLRGARCFARRPDVSGQPTRAAAGEGPRTDIVRGPSMLTL